MPTTPTYHKRISTRAKRLRITVYPDKRVVVTIPHKLQDDIITTNKFIADHTDWIEKQLAKLAAVPLVSYPFTTGKRSYTKYKKSAAQKIAKRVVFLNKQTGLHFSFNNITIRNQKTRWGSCSSQKNLNFNYKLAFLPQHLMDYIIIHELCHLKHMHHGKAFWELVGQVCPDYKQYEQQLRTRFTL